MSIFSARKILVAGALFIGFSMSASAQTVHAVKIDFKNKTLTPPKGRVRPSDQLQLVVECINPALYKIEMDAVDSTVPTPVASALPDFFLKSDNLSSIAGTLLSATGIIPVKQANVENYLKKMSEVDDKTKANLFTAMNTVADGNHQSKPRKCNYLCGVNNLQLLHATLIGTLRDDIEKERDAIGKVLFDYELHFGALRKANATDNDFKPDVKELPKTLVEHRKKLTELSNDARKQGEAYAKGMAVLSTEPDAAELEGKQLAADTLIRNFYGRAQTELAGDRAEIGYAKVLTLLARFDTMALLTSTYKSLPMYINADTKRFSIHITPRAEAATNLSSYNTVFYVPRTRYRVYGVGAGLHVDGLGSRAYVVTSDSVPNSTREYRVVEDEKGGSAVGIGLNAQAYFGYKLSPNDWETPLYFGPSFGGGLSLEKKPKPRFMLGGAFIVGERQRIMVSGGASAGFVTRASAYYTDGSFGQAPSDYLQDVTRVSWYLSLSYSFLGNSGQD